MLCPLQHLRLPFCDEERLYSRDGKPYSWHSNSRLFFCLTSFHTSAGPLGAGCLSDCAVAERQNARGCSALAAADQQSANGGRDFSRWAIRRASAQRIWRL